MPDFWGSTPSTDLNTLTPDDKTQTRLIGTGNGSILTRVLPDFDGRVWQSDGDPRLRQSKCVADWECPQALGLAQELVHHGEALNFASCCFANGISPERPLPFPLTLTYFVITFASSSVLSFSSTHSALSFITAHIACSIFSSDEVLNSFFYRSPDFHLSYSSTL